MNSNLQLLTRDAVSDNSVCNWLDVTELAAVLAEMIKASAPTNNADLTRPQLREVDDRITEWADENFMQRMVDHAYDAELVSKDELRDYVTDSDFRDMFDDRCRDEDILNSAEIDTRLDDHRDDLKGYSDAGDDALRVEMREYTDHAIENLDSHVNLLAAVRSMFAEMTAAERISLIGALLMPPPAPQPEVSFLRRLDDEEAAAAGLAETTPKADALTDQILDQLGIAEPTEDKRVMQPFSLGPTPHPSWGV